MISTMLENTSNKFLVALRRHRISYVEAQFMGDFVGKSFVGGKNRHPKQRNEIVMWYKRCDAD